MAVYNNILAGASGQTSGAAAGFQVDRSLRFNSDDSAYLNRTPSSAGNRKTFTWSGWVKRTKIPAASEFIIFGAGTSGMNLCSLSFETDDNLRAMSYNGSYVYQKISNAVFRDPSAWYHIVYAVDTTDSTAEDRVKLYVNGERITSFSTNTNPSQNADVAHINSTSTHYVNKYITLSSYGDFYLAEVHFVDGTQLAATDFGEPDNNGVWQPKDCKDDLTYGTNGFYLKFADNSSNAALGTDSSGNSNTWTVNNLVAVVDEINASSSEISNPNNSVANHLNIFDGDTSTTVSSGNGGRVIWTPSSNISISKIEGYFDDSLNGYRITMSVSGGSSQTITVDTSSGGTANQWNEFGDLSGDTIGPSNAITFSMLRPAGNDTDPGLHDLNALRINDKLVVLNSSQAGVDSLIDTPTDYTAESGNNGGNYATWNPLQKYSAITLSNGNLDFTDSNSVNGGDQGVHATIAPVSGKFYWEMTLSTLASENYIGISKSDKLTQTIWTGGAVDGYYYYNNGKKIGGGNGNGGETYGDSFGANDVIGVAVDWDNGKVTFYKNGTSQGDAFTGKDLTGYIPAYYFNTNQSSAGVVNFGQRPFAYTPPTGYVSLCTQNLADPTIADGSTAFDVITATGTAADRTFTMPGGFGPDLVWGKERGNATNHALFDTVRGATKRLVSNSTQAEDTQANQLKSFTSTGFTYGSDIPNNSSQTGVYWCWDAGTSTASNTDGSITSSVRANQTAGFSVVTYTGSGSNATVGHGLSSPVKWILVKDRSQATGFSVYHDAIGTSTNNYIELQSTAVAAASDNAFQKTAPTSSVFSIGTKAATNESGDNFVALCWSEVEGFSKFGEYTGASNLFIYTGFKPAWLLLKSYAGDGYNWVIIDDQRGADSSNVSKKLYANLSDEEDGDSRGNETKVVFLSNGFTFLDQGAETNSGSRSYIYAAFASHPLKYSRAGF